MSGEENIEPSKHANSCRQTVHSWLERSQRNKCEDTTLVRRWVPGSSWRGSKVQSATGGGSQPGPLWFFSSLDLSSKPVSKPLKGIGHSHACFLPKWSTELGYCQHIPGEGRISSARRYTERVRGSKRDPQSATLLPPWRIFLGCGTSPQSVGFPKGCSQRQRPEKGCGLPCRWS